MTYLLTILTMLMKRCTLVRKTFLAATMGGMSIRAEEAQTSPTATEAAHVLGPISDGSPSAPLKPQPKIETTPEDILETKVRELDGRKITIQKVTPVELPQETEPKQPVKQTAEQRAAWEARRQQMKKTEHLFLSTSVYLSLRYPGGVRTLFRWESKDRKRQFEAWSTVDATWMTGFANFQTSTTIYSIFMGCSSLDVDRLELLYASRGRGFKLPLVPEIPQGDAQFVVTKGNPSPEELAPILAIQNLYKTEGEKLRLAHEGRIRAQKEQEAFLKANPPKPQDIVIRYWRIEKPVATGNAEGGGR